MYKELPPAIRETLQASRFINRELSWLAFNNRVLDEAFNTAHPPLERLNFLVISAANLDEFYMVRVSRLRTRIYKHDATIGNDGLTPLEQLAAVTQAIVATVKRQQQCLQELRRELERHNITIASPSKLSRADTAWLRDFFRSMVMPLLTPIAVDPAHPFPFIPNKGIALVLQMTEPETGDVKRHLVLLPPAVGRFVRLNVTKEDAQQPRYMLLERVIMMFVEELIPGFVMQASGILRVLRNSELEVASGKDDLLSTYETAVKKRRYGQVIRLAIHHETPKDLRQFLQEEIGAEEEDVFIINGMNGLADLGELLQCGRPDLRFPPYEPRHPERIRDYNGDAFSAIKAKDIVIHHPFESFDVVVHFLRQAASDPNVLAIKQTLYRTSNDSPIVAALIEAAMAGKSVTAMIELKARFDEEANIRWARDLERAGAQVVYGFVDLKTHAKLSLVVRKESGELRSYVHIGTGNYHPQTAKVYTDLSFFTCDPAIGRDVASLFNYMTCYAEPKALEKCAFSPVTMRNHIYTLIDEEIAHAKAGRPATIWAKMNALVDPSMIDKLYEAAQAGVEITLLIRGICCLKPGVPGLSERITVIAAAGRFLEHSRIVCFGNGHPMPSPEAKIFMMSSDWMTRNLDWRIEVMVPIETPSVHQQVLSQIMVAYMKDNKQSWVLDSEGSYHRLSPIEGEQPFSAHHYFMTNPSLSGRGSALLQGQLPPELKLDE